MTASRASHAPARVTLIQIVGNRNNFYWLSLVFYRERGRGQRRRAFYFTI